MITALHRLNRYLLITLTVCFAAGITGALHLPPLSLPIASVVTIISLSLLLCWWFRLHMTTLVLLCLTFAFTGLLHATSELQNRMEPNNVSMFFNEREEALIAGTLKSMISGSDQFKKFIVDSRYLKKKSSDSFSNVSGKILFTLQGHLEEPFKPGDSIIIRAELRKPAQPRSPGAFDYSRYLTSKDIYLTGFVASPLFIQKIELGDSIVYNPSYTIENLRQMIAMHLTSVLTDDFAALYKAILLGDKSEIDDLTLETFKKSGTLHILAISGMHMALLGLFSFACFYWLLKRSERLMLAINVKKLSMFLCIPLLLAYTLLAGANIPVMRSFIMSLFVIFALCTNRLKSPLTILAGAGFFMLIIDPLSIETVSFQLSFAAVASIVLITPSLLSRLPEPRAPFDGKNSTANTLMKWLKTMLAVTISATVGTAPLLLYHFNHISLVAIIANLIIEPAICLWSLPLGFTGVSSLFLSDSLAELFFKAGVPGLALATKAAQTLSELPFSSLWLPDISPLLIVLYYCSLLFILGRFSVFIKTSATVLFATMLILFITPLTPLAHRSRNQTVVSIIDVGQGSSNLLELADGRNIIIDAGSLARPGFDCGSQIVAPYLWSRGIGRLDDIIITHADADHYNGISALIDRFSVKRVLIPGTPVDSHGYNDLIKKIKNKKIEIVFVETDISFIEDTTDLQIISSGLVDAEKTASQGYDKLSDNDSGLLVRLSTPHFSILFPGDISAEREQQLVDSGRPLKTDILLSPHHGSSTSNSQSFLLAVAPDVLVVSSGMGQPLSFPSKQTRANAAHLEIPVLTTAHEGTITIISERTGYHMKSFLKDEKEANR